MAQFNKGDTFTDGEQVTGARLNQLVDSATLSAGSIIEQTAMTANTVAANDSVLLYDLSDTGLRKPTVGDVLNSNLPISTSSITGGAGVDVIITPASGREVDIAGNFQVIGNSITTGTASVGGTLGVTGNVTASANLTVNGTTNLVGISTAPTAAANTNTTQIATTAFVMANQPPQLVKAFADVRVIGAGTRTASFLSGTYSRTTTLVTVTITGHGLSTGQIVGLDFTTGTALDGFYPVTVTGANTFTITTVASGATSGNVQFNIVIKSSLNIASITQLGNLLAGDRPEYIITFTTPLTDANYVVNANLSGTGYTGTGLFGLEIGVFSIRTLANYTKTASQFRIGQTAYSYDSGSYTLSDFSQWSDFSFSVIR